MPFGAIFVAAFIVSWGHPKGFIEHSLMLFVQVPPANPPALDLSYASPLRYRTMQRGLLPEIPAVSRSEEAIPSKKYCFLSTRDRSRFRSPRPGSLCRF